MGSCYTYMSVSAHLSLGILADILAVDDDLKYVKKTKAASAETKAEGGGVDKS
jgi:hypothetical protein